MSVVWKDIKGYEGLYEVSNNGHIRSYKKTGPGSETYNNPKLLKLIKERHGYRRIALYKNKKSKYMEVHRLVAKTFIPNPGNKEFINHKDGNKSNNHVDNLEWVTRQENENHAKLNGLKPRGERCGKSKLTRVEVLQIRHEFKNKEVSIRYLEGKYNVTYSTIHSIINRKSWKHI